MKQKLFPEGSFCIQLTNKQGDEMFKQLEKKKIPFTYIYDGEYTGGAIDSIPNKTPKVILQLSDNGKNWLASPDYLKRSKDGICVRLITPEQPDDGKPLPEFKDIFVVKKVTKKMLEKRMANKK